MLGGDTGWGVLGTVLLQGLCLTSLLSWGMRPLFCPANSCDLLPTATTSLSGDSCQSQVVCLDGKTVV